MKILAEHSRTLRCAFDTLASRFLVPEFPLLVHTPFLSSALLYGMIFPSSPAETLSGFLQLKPQDMSFSKPIDLPCFPHSADVFLRHKSLFIVCLSWF